MKGDGTGITTGTCAAAAAKAAVMLLKGDPLPSEVSVKLPSGESISLPIFGGSFKESKAFAQIKKFSGDDPDVTDGCIIVAYSEWLNGLEVELAAGEGVGTVTKPGLSIPPGEPAINPVPRSMIRQAVRDVTSNGVKITISIPGGRELAQKTFNPKLGVVGGLSILGTSGIIRPFSAEALRDSLKCALSVALACGVTQPVFVPGRIGEKAARNLLRISEDQLLEVSNEWGFILDEASHAPFKNLLVLGHPGKLAKIPAGWWDTHSSRSGSAVPFVLDLLAGLHEKMAEEPLTVEAIFGSLNDEAKTKLAHRVADRIRSSIQERICSRFDVAVILVSLNGTMLGSAGNIRPWL